MKTSVNLMTEEALRSQILREQRRLWGGALVWMAVLLVSFGVTEWWQMRSTSQRLASLESQYAPVESLRHACIAMRQETNELREAQQLTLRLVDNQPVVTLLGAVSAAAAECDGNVFVGQLEIEPDDESQGHGNRRRAMVSGIGRTNADVAQFAASLRTSGLFADVRLDSTTSDSSKQGRGQSFRIECRM